MSQKTLKIAGCVLSIALGLLFALSAFLKLTQNEAALAQAASIGFSADTYFVIATHLQHQQPAGMAIAVQMLLWITLAVRFPQFLKSLFSKARPSYQQF